LVRKEVASQGQLLFLYVKQKYFIFEKKCWYLMKQFGFGKAEKLKSSKSISELFTRGNSEFEFPLKLIFQKLENSGEPNKVAFVASKKKYPKAHQRNRIKRILRETYRLNKSDFSQMSSTLNCSYNLIIVYVGDVNILFDKTEKAIKSLLLKVSTSNQEK
jgi:ribonuclease P protein component